MGLFLTRQAHGSLLVRSPLVECEAEQSLLPTGAYRTPKQSQNYTNPRIVIFYIFVNYQTFPPFRVLRRCKTCGASDLWLAGHLLFIY